MNRFPSVVRLQAHRPEKDRALSPPFGFRALQEGAEVPADLLLEGLEARLRFQAAAQVEGQALEVERGDAGRHGRAREEVGHPHVEQEGQLADLLQVEAVLQQAVLILELVVPRPADADGVGEVAGIEASLEAQGFEARGHAFH